MRKEHLYICTVQCDSHWPHAAGVAEEIFHFTLINISVNNHAAQTHMENQSIFLECTRICTHSMGRRSHDNTTPNVTFGETPLHACGNQQPFSVRIVLTWGIV